MIIYTGIVELNGKEFSIEHTCGTYENINITDLQTRRTLLNQDCKFSIESGRLTKEEAKSLMPEHYKVYVAYEQGEV
jgi:hypothetical protein